MTIVMNITTIMIITSLSVSVCNCSQEKSLAKLLTDAIDCVMLSAISPGLDKFNYFFKIYIALFQDLSLRRLPFSNLRIPKLSVSSSRLLRLLPSPESQEETMSGVSHGTWHRVSSLTLTTSGCHCQQAHQHHCHQFTSHSSEKERDDNIFT